MWRCAPKEIDAINIYWAGLLAWMKDVCLADGKISPADLEMLVLTDDLDEAVRLMVEAREPR